MTVVKINCIEHAWKKKSNHEQFTEQLQGTTLIIYYREKKRMRLLKNSIISCGGILKDFIFTWFADGASNNAPLTYKINQCQKLDDR